MPMQISSVTKSFGVDTILDNISMNISDNEKVGLIGANGAGKTTLLKIIAGEISYDSGTVYTPKDSKIGFLKQTAIEYGNRSMWDDCMEIFSDVTTLENEMRLLEIKMSDERISEEERLALMNSYSRASSMFDSKGGFDIQTKIRTILSGMGFDGFDLYKTSVSTLSGGEKTKFAFAKLLLLAPEVLLLDEPTNHLDFRTMQWLENYLRSYRGIIITVSHDRYFLDSIADNIYEIENTKSVKYTGNYSAYLETKKHNYEINLKHYEQQQSEIKRLEDYVAKNKVRASSAKMAKSKQKSIDRIEVIEKPLLFTKACNFKFELEYPSYKDVLKCEELELCVNGGGIFKKIADNINIDVKRGETVAIIGNNGVGKSTLLKTLTGENKNYGGSFEFGRNTVFSFYDQEQRLLHDSSSVLNEIWDRFPSMDEVEVRSLLGRVLFLDEDVYKNVSDLSGGERARLMLLVIMLEKSNTLLLDEPTNHLDLPSKEALDLAVKGFDGTVILVSHDRYFLNKTADRILELTPHGIQSYEGNYDSYIEKKTFGESNSKTTEEKNKVTPTDDYETNKRRQANIKNLNKKISNAEQQISETENKIEELKKRITDAGSDYGKVSELYSESEKCEKELNNLYDLWNNLNEELETIV